jgi:hypothetical protein
MKADTPKRDERDGIRPVVVNVRTDARIERQERLLPKPKAPNADSYARFLLNRHQHVS